MPPLTFSDGSSAVSGGKKDIVTNRDGGLCVLCGVGPIDIAHIVARKSGDPGTVNWIRRLSPSLRTFRKDELANLICLCPTHHRQFNRGYFVFIPARNNRQNLRKHEIQDFAIREQCLDNGEPDPGRTFPPIPFEVEFVPIYAGQYNIVVHHPTPSDPTLFAFDTHGNRLCEILHFQASFIALMLQAHPSLASVTRISNLTTDLAAQEVIEIMRLYNRTPQEELRRQSIPVPIGANQLLESITQSGTYFSTHMLSTIPGSPTLSDDSQSTPFPSVHQHESIVPGLTPSSSTSTNTNIGSEFDDAYNEADSQLLKYANEPAMSSEELKNRVPLLAGEQAGSWRFATAEEICRGWQ